MYFYEDYVVFKSKAKKMGDIMNTAAHSAVSTMARLYNYEMNDFKTDVSIINGRVYVEIYVYDAHCDEKVLVAEEYVCISEYKSKTRSAYVATTLLEMMIRNKDRIDDFIFSHMKTEEESNYPDYEKLYKLEKSVCHKLQKELDAYKKETDDND